jgi:hypothetical protein
MEQPGNGAGRDPEGAPARTYTRRSGMFTRTEIRRRKERRKELGNQLRGMVANEWSDFPNIFRAITKAQWDAHDVEYIHTDDWHPCRLDPDMVGPL